VFKSFITLKKLMLVEALTIYFLMEFLLITLAEFS